MHVGTYFVFAFPDVHFDDYNCEFVITALADATVHVTAPVVDLNRTDHIAQGTAQLYTFKCDDLEVTSGVENKSIIVTSNVDIQVEVMPLVEYSYGDTFLVLPVHPASTEFITAAYFDPGLFPTLYTLVIVVPSEPNTIVNVYR